MQKVLTIFFIIGLSFRCSLLAQAPSYAQKQNNEWAFAGSGFNFNNDTLQLLHTTSTIGGNNFVSQALASVCDVNGNLLFYTDGYGIYEGNPAPGNNNYYMPNAYPVLAGTLNVSPSGGWSSGGSAQNIVCEPLYDGSVIVPMIDSPGKYYVFNNEYYYDQVSCKLYYSVVDMSLNQDYGDVEPGKKAVLLDSNLAFPLEAIVGNDCNVWLLVHDLDNTYKAYNITGNGIGSVPVLSTGANVIGYPAGTFYNQVTSSPDRKKLASDGYEYGIGTMEISDFDPATGMVSNSLLQYVDANSLLPMLAFSPDNTKLYSAVGTGSNGANCCGPTALVQYDISNGSGPWNPVIADTTTINSPGGTGGNMGLPYCARLGPDGKIYMNNRSVIDYPNLDGVACHAHFLPANIENAFSDNTETAGLWSLPFNATPVLPNHDTVTITQKLNSCFAGSAVVMTASDTTGWNYTWSDYSEYRLHTNHRTIDTPGVFVLTYNTKGCQYHIDSFVVGHISYTVNLGADTTFCNGSGSTYVLQPHDSTTGSSYQWQDGSSNNTDTATTTGTYWVTVNNQGCIASDTALVRFIDVRQSLGNDTTFCAEHPIVMILHADTVAGAALLWSDGSTGPILQVQDTGIYWVTVTDASCVASDTIQIHAAYCDCAFGMPSAFTPNGDGKNDVFRPVLPSGCKVQGYSLTIYNRWGQEVFNSSVESAGWDGTFNGIPADIGSYRYVVQFEAGTNNEKKYQKGDVTLIR